MAHPITSNETYSWDLELFKKLGLKDFKDLPHGETCEVGDIEGVGASYDYHVLVRVCCLPAQFWQFEIELFHKDTHELRQKLKLSTGSSDFTSAWKTIEQICNDMLVIDYAGEPQ